MNDFNKNIQAKLDTRDRSSDMLAQPYQVPVIDVERVGRSLGETFTTRDLWEGDVRSIPYEPSCEEAAMEELDEHIRQQVTISKADGPIVVKVVSRYRDDAGNLVGKRNVRLQLDTRIYNVSSQMDISKDTPQIFYLKH